MNQKTYRSDWKVFVKKNIGSAAKVAALLNVHRNTANSYINNPLQMSINDLTIIVMHTGCDQRELINLMLQHK